MTGVLFNVTGAVSVIWLNRRAASVVRATVHSLLSQAESIGEICGEFALAAPARADDISAALIASGALAARTGLGGGPVAHRRRDRARALA